MSHFKVKRISNRPPRKPLSEKTKQNIITALSIIVLLLAIYYGSLRLIDALSGSRIVTFIANLFGKELIMDNRGHTNILLLGVGGEGHEGKDLTDTLIVASIDQTNKEVALLSFPRDFYVESSLGGMRINRLYEQGKIKWGSEQALDFVQTTIQEVLDIPLHYYVKADFEAFEKVVDSVGGIDIQVEETIDDPFYPRDETYEFERFYLEAGNQHLDGKTALKYARSRKTSSDFDRSKRQQRVLIALKNQVADMNILGRKHVLKQLYYSLRDHVETNMSVREMLSLADFGTQWSTDKLATATLNDEPVFRGGFLYTPLRELYGGAFVLLPAGDNFDAIRNFAQLLMYGPKNLKEFPVAILNATKIHGLAGNMRGILYRFGIAIGDVGNARSQNLPTKWYIRDQSADSLLNFLQKLIPGTVSMQIPTEYENDPDLASSKIILELGEDSEQIIEKLDIFKNVVPLNGVTSNGQPVTLPQIVPEPAA